MSTIKLLNPFVVGHYETAEYFCDRENEIQTLIKHIENGRIFPSLNVYLLNTAKVLIQRRLR